MKIFIDTSALVKFFHKEIGTDYVTKLINDQKNEIYISDLAKIEFISAMFRRYRTNDINEKILYQAIKNFEDQIKIYNSEKIDNIVINRSIKLLKNFGKENGIKSLDSLHLAAFVSKFTKSDYFVSADDVLCNIVKTLGYNIINPVKL